MRWHSVLWHNSTILCLAILTTWTNYAVAQSTALDLIPADAAVAIVIRNPDELRKKGDDFLKEANLDFGIRPTDLLTFVTNLLGINQGLDLEQPSGAAILRPEKAPQNLGFEDFNQSFYVALAFSDLDKMASNFGFKPGQLKPDTVTRIDGPNRPFGQYVYVRGKHLYIATSDSPLKRLSKAKLLTSALSPEQRQTFGKLGVLGYLKPEALGGEWRGIVKMIEEELAKGNDPSDRETVGQIVKTLNSLRFTLVGLEVGDGLGLKFLTVFSQENKEALQGLLGALGDKSGAHLKGLPQGRVVAAQAYAGDGAKNAIFARVFVNFLMKQFLENRQITSATDRPAFVGVFDEVWQRLQASRVGIYLTRDESKSGLFSIVAILDTQDAKTFLASMRTLAKIADGTLDLTKTVAGEEINIDQWIKDLSSEKYQVRASATTRLRLLGEPALAYLEKAAATPPDLETSRRAQLLIREISAVAAERRKELLTKDLPRYVRPTFTFVTQAETRGGLPIDIVHVKLQNKDQLASGQMKQLFGPDWDKLRLAVHGQQVVVLLGSELDLFEAALTNLKEAKDGLASSNLTAGYDKARPKNATSIFYLSLNNMLALVRAQARKQEPSPLTSFTLTMEDASLQLDLFLPIIDIRAVDEERRR